MTRDLRGDLRHAAPIAAGCPRRDTGRRRATIRRRSPPTSAARPASQSTTRPSPSCRASCCSTADDKVDAGAGDLRLRRRARSAPLRSPAAMDAVTVIREGRGNELGRARLFCALARANGLPCRVMAGIVPGRPAARTSSATGTRSTSAAAGCRSTSSSASPAALPPDRLSLGAGARRRPGARHQRQRARPTASTCSRSSRPTPSWCAGASPTRSTRSIALSLLFLPVQLQHTLRILLLVPLGALAMCVLRNIVGLRTFGMFMPMLIALAFTGTGLLWGTLFLAVDLSLRAAVAPVDPAPLPAARGAHRLHPHARRPADGRALHRRRPARHADAPASAPSPSSS